MDIREAFRAAAIEKWHGKPKRVRATVPPVTLDGPYKCGTGTLLWWAGDRAIYAPTREQAAIMARQLRS